MPSIQPPRLGEHDVELRGVGVPSVVGHGYPARTAVRQHEVLILKRIPEDAASPGAVLSSDVACLHDEVLHHAVDRGTFVVQAFVAFRQRHEIQTGHRRYIRKYSDDETSFKVLSRSIHVFHHYVKPDLVGDRVLGAVDGRQ